MVESNTQDMMEKFSHDSNMQMRFFKSNFAKLMLNFLSQPFLINQIALTATDNQIQWFLQKGLLWTVISDHNQVLHHQQGQLSLGVSCKNCFLKKIILRTYDTTLYPNISDKE